MTGGQWSASRVQVYSVSGPQEELPNMLAPRYGHACGLFVNSDQQTVKSNKHRYAIHNLKCMIVQLVQVYLVTGGSPLSSAGDTTELLVHGDNSWTSSGRLPTPRTRLRGATINNKIVVTGKDVTWSSRAN